MDPGAIIYGRALLRILSILFVVYKLLEFIDNPGGVGECVPIV